MPELPEVETIVNQLRHKILGKKILKAEVLDAIVDSGISKLPLFHVKEIYRRAKYIIFALDTGKFILTHLGMTGQFFFVEKSQIEEKKRFYQPHQVAKFMFEDGSLLSHNNMRKFGSMRLLDEKELQKVLSKLGPEPLEE
ncbi:MAG: DNA-formamidopyrimidine glycosylase family protein, partial [Nanoarchaeota archaeon]